MIEPGDAAKPKRHRTAAFMRSIAHLGGAAAAKKGHLPQIAAMGGRALSKLRAAKANAPILGRAQPQQDPPDEDDERTAIDVDRLLAGIERT